MQSLNQKTTPSTQWGIGLLGIFLGTWGVLSGCGGKYVTRGKAPIEIEVARSPIVEAYVEYLGPSERWAGPGSFLMHIDLKNKSEGVKVSVTPPYLKPSVKTEGPGLVQDSVSDRKVASAESPKAGSESPRTTEAVEQLNALADAMKQDESPFFGCLNPVHARLIRADGTVEEKKGCRSELGWAGAASRTVSSFMETL